MSLTFAAALRRGAPSPLLEYEECAGFRRAAVAILR
jgi:hypothetical protein